MPLSRHLLLLALCLAFTPPSCEHAPAGPPATPTPLSAPDLIKLSSRGPWEIFVDNRAVNGEYCDYVIHRDGVSVLQIPGHKWPANDRARWPNDVEIHWSPRGDVFVLDEWPGPGITETLPICVKLHTGMPQIFTGSIAVNPPSNGIVENAVHFSHWSQNGDPILRRTW